MNPFLRAFRAYITLMHRLYYPAMHVVGREMVPPEGVPNVMVGCHQNCLVDAVSAHIAIKERKAYGLARSGAFKGRMASWLLPRMGLLPISRMNFEGEEEVKRHNATSLRNATEILKAGHTLMLFPEAGHQDKRWLGYFSLAYVRLAFEAAKATGYKEEVYITPYAHHYGHYHHPFYQMMIIFGEPLPLSTYYERYQSRPRTCQREISAIIEGRISGMMLDVRDTSHYQAIDYLRESGFGKGYCAALGLDPRHLPDKLAADKLLVSALAQIPEEGAESVYGRLKELDTRIKANGMRDWLFDTKFPTPRLLATVVALLVGALPAAVAALPTAPVFILPEVLKRRPINGAVDRMFDSTYDLGATVLVTFPLFGLLPALPLCFLTWGGLLWPLLYMAMILYLCRYRRLLAKAAGLWNYCVARRQTAKDIKQLRTETFGDVRRMLREHVAGRDAADEKRKTTSCNSTE